MQRILLATDGSQHARAAVDFLSRLPLEPGTGIHVVHVVDPFIERLLEQVNPDERGVADRLVGEAVSLASHDDRAVTSSIRGGSPAHEIIKAAREIDADLVVLGSRGLTGAESFLLGSVARNVVHHAHCSVLVARPIEHALREVVIATDGSEHARQAVRLAAAMPLPAETAFRVVSVVKPVPPASGWTEVESAALFEAIAANEVQNRRLGERLAGEAADALKPTRRPVDVEVPCGDPAREILAIARDHKADLIIAGARGVSLLERLTVGSVADRLLRTAPCSVLLVR